MKDTLSVKIILPSASILSAEASMVNLHGEEGMFGVLPGHCKFISNLATGIVSVFLKDDESKYFVFDGIAEITGDEVNIISEFAVNLETETKTSVMEHIELLKNSLLDHQEGLQANVILDKIEKYQALLKFL